MASLSAVVCRSVVAFVAVVLSVSVAHAQEVGCDDLATRDADLSRAQVSIEGLIARDTALIAAFVRAAFHDCITATRDNPTSGCNGSLRFDEELQDGNNQRLDVPINALEGVIAGTCTSMADAIQLASARSVRAAGGPDVTQLVVSASTPRADATSPDTVAGELPSSDFSLRESFVFYREKGFTTTDLVASLAGGHSIGGFGRGTILPFTPDETTISPSFAANLVTRADGAAANAERFNTLPADDALITSGTTVNILRSYSTCTSTEVPCAEYDPTAVQALNSDFARFLVKASRLTGRTVGRARLLASRL